MGENEFTAREIFEAFHAFKQLAQTKFSPKTSYRIAKIMSKLESEFKLIEDQRVALVKELGAPNESTGQYEIKSPEALSKFNLQFNELLDQNSISFDYQPIPLGLLGETNEFPPGIFVYLQRFFSDS